MLRGQPRAALALRSDGASAMDSFNPVNLTEPTPIPCLSYHTHDDVSFITGMHYCHVLYMFRLTEITTHKIPKETTN